MELSLIPSNHKKLNPFGMLEKTELKCQTKMLPEVSDDSKLEKGLNQC